ncbi:MAG: choice-of-anchor D domain-containing protein, partial [Hyphomicrobiaceae bacterium]|nr:choice-of-anchor D domain-containing protein [Hyphomicrobiaceae bacterium]
MLDGFTISGGNANGSYPNNDGGGMFNLNGSPSLTNVTFSENSASNRGGGMYNESSNPSLLNVTFSGNSASNRGGGMYNIASISSLTNVIFSGNSAYYGGGMYNNASSPSLTNVTFSGNSANYGGGMSNIYSISNPLIQNSIFWNNTAISGVSISNAESSTPTIRYSLVQGCNPGGGSWDSDCGANGGNNFNDADPLFVTPVDPATAPTTSGDLRLRLGSPAIDVGDNNADLDGAESGTTTISDIAADLTGNPRIVNATVDLGAYEKIPTPEMDVQGNGLSIPDGDATPEAVEDTEFGGVEPNGGTVSHTFTIKNNGDAELTLNGTPLVAVSGTNAASFTVTTQPSSPVTASGGTTAVTVEFDPSSLGIHSATLSIANNSDYQNPYTFDIQGFGRGILYAKSAAAGDCSTWINACTLQTALTNATSGDEIWVMAGTHKPDTTARAETFQLKNGVKVYGGFAGTESDLNERNWENNTTILSGDIGEPSDDTDNIYHVVTGSGTDSSTLLDGFTISGGNANGSYPDDRGGGMYNNSGSPSLMNVTFSGNSADYGGGMYNESNSPSLTNVTFIGNSATQYGGGMHNNGSSPSLTNVTFSGNSAYYGGGMHNNGSSPLIQNSIFWNNA